jgi:hypothetical protein
MLAIMSPKTNRNDPSNVIYLAYPASTNLPTARDEQRTRDPRIDPIHEMADGLSFDSNVVV